MVPEQMEALQSRFAECKAVALADISSTTVLCVSAKVKPPQERLDELCDTAAEMLGGKTAQILTVAVDSDGDAGLQESIMCENDETLVFLRSSSDPAEVLLCICSSDVDIGEFLIFGREKLRQMAAEQ